MRRHCESKCSDIKNYIVSVSIVFVISLSRSTRSTHVFLLLFYCYYYFIIILLLLFRSFTLFVVFSVDHHSDQSVPDLKQQSPLNVPSCLRVQYVFSPFLVVGLVFYSCSSWNVHYSLFVSLLMPLCFVSAIYAQKRSTHLSLLSVVCVQTLNVSTSHFSTLSLLDWQLFS